MTQKDRNRWTTQRFSMWAIAVLIVASIGLVTIDKDITPLVALAGLLFTYAGAIVKFNYETSPSPEQFDKEPDNV